MLQTCRWEKKSKKVILLNIRNPVHVIWYYLISWSSIYNGADAYCENRAVGSMNLDNNMISVFYGGILIAIFFDFSFFITSSYVESEGEYWF